MGVECNPSVHRPAFSPLSHTSQGRICSFDGLLLALHPCLIKKKGHLLFALSCSFMSSASSASELLLLLCPYSSKPLSSPCMLLGNLPQFSLLSFLFFFFPYSHFYCIFFLHEVVFFLLSQFHCNQRKYFLVSYFFLIERNPIVITHLLLVQGASIDFLTLCKLIKVCFLNIRLIKLTSVFTNSNYLLKERAGLYSSLCINSL